jgi:glycine cleavage system H protein
LLYTKDHEWAKRDDSVVTIGITSHAQDALGEIVFADLPKIGRQLKTHEVFGVVESIKAVSDLYSPVAGEVVETNPAVTGNPSLINTSSYGDGWLIRVKLSDPSTLDGLMNASQYKAYVEGLK